MLITPKVVFAVMAVIIACFSTALAVNVDSLRTDMAVPGSPAFNLMDVDQSAIMRPGTAKEIAISIGNIMLGGVVLPQTFGVELSPGMMLMKKSLHEYQTNAKKRFLYRLNLSGGVTRAGGEVSAITLGTRFTLFDETDLLADTNFTRLLIDIGGKINSELAGYTSLNIPPDYPFSSDTLKIRYYESLIATEATKINDKYSRIIKEKRDSVKQTQWNKAILEAGLAGMGASPDSTTENLIATKYGLWLTYGDGLWENNLNLVGLRLLAARDTSNAFKQVNGSIVLRSYIGENNYKGYLEGDGTYSNQDIPSYAVSLGGEMNIANGIWLETSAGVKKQGKNRTEVISSFNLKLSTPEIK